MKILFKRAFKMRTIIDRFGGETLRYFLMTTQYRNPLAYELTVEGRRLLDEWAGALQGSRERIDTFLDRYEGR